MLPIINDSSAIFKHLAFNCAFIDNKAKGIVRVAPVVAAIRNPMHFTQREAVCMMKHALFTLTPMTEEHGRAICSWSYPAPFDIYNWPSWEDMVKHEKEFADPHIRQEQYCAVLDANAELCGYAQFFPIVGVTRLGLGLRPDLCGKGYGVAFVRAIVKEAYRRSPGNEIDLEVLVNNRRAIRTYEKAGFAITDSYERLTPDGMNSFYCMVFQGFHS
jgi:ribosomal protein S18 acetylase RimI-like enzyme